MIAIRDLVKNALRMRPDRIVVGEVRDGAALDMLQAMNTGHDGSITTVHANTPRDSLSRLETMVLMAGVELPVRAIREQVAGALDLIIQQARLKDGSRRITAISEVVGMEGEVITLQDLFTFDFSAGRDEHGRFRGQLVSTGLRPKFTQDLVRPRRRPAAEHLHVRRAMTTTRRPVRRRLRAAAVSIACLALARCPRERGSGRRGRAGVAERPAARPPPPSPAPSSCVGPTPSSSTRSRVDRDRWRAERAGHDPARGVRSPHDDARHRHEWFHGRLRHGDRPGRGQGLPRDGARGRQGRRGLLRVDVRRRRQAHDGPHQGAEGRQRPTSRGETALYAGVQDAVRALGAKGERSIVLLSDGGDTVEAIKGGEAREAAQRKAAVKALSAGKVRAEVVAFKSAGVQRRGAPGSSPRPGWIRRDGGQPRRGRRGVRRRGSHAGVAGHGRRPPTRRRDRHVKSSSSRAPRRVRPSPRRVTSTSVTRPRS